MAEESQPAVTQAPEQSAALSLPAVVSAATSEVAATGGRRLAEALQQRAAGDTLVDESKLYLVVLNLDSDSESPAEYLQVLEMLSPEQLMSTLQGYQQSQANVVVHAFFGCLLPITSEPLTVTTPFGVLQPSAPKPQTSSSAAYFGGRRLPPLKDPSVGTAVTRDYQLDAATQPTDDNTLLEEPPQPDGNADETPV